MAITTGDGYIASLKDSVQIVKAAVTTIANVGWWITRQVASIPPAVTLATSNGAVTTGTVPTDATAGSPSIGAFVGAALGYVTYMAASCSVACRIAIDDLLWYSASIPTNAAATTTFTGNPSFSTRVPSGTDFRNCRLWVEVNTAITTTSPTVTIIYTNQDGVAGRTTGAFVLPAVAQLTLGRWVQIPLATGDSGVQIVQSIQITTPSAAGAVNVIVAKEMWRGRIAGVNGEAKENMVGARMPQVFTNSHIVARIWPDSTSTGVADIAFEIASG